jgi:sortase A
VIHTIRRWLARLLIAGGAAVLLWVGADLVLTTSSRRHYEAALESMRRLPATDVRRTGPASLAIGEPIGTLEIARVGLSGVVVEGDEDSVLDRAIGHLPDTPLPWHAGNSALAAHRDALFRPLKGVRLGDILRLRTPHGDFEYLVRDIQIVKPDALWVLDPTPVPMLTLISCWPFNYIGHAPERFIVRAERTRTATKSTETISHKEHEDH